MGYGYPPPQPGTEPLSIWSLVLGILSFVFCPLVAAIPAIITGIKAKKAISRSGGVKTGRGMAQAGMILGWVNVAISVVAAVFLGIGASIVVSHPSYTSLNPGDCFNPRTGSLSGRISKVSCGKPHTDEAVGVFDLNDGPYPGASGVAAVAETRCNDLARSYGVSPQPGLQLRWLYPSRISWDDGTRTLVCSVRNSDGSRRTGSLGGGAGGTAMAP
jgi:hypothetical protein